MSIPSYKEHMIASAVWFHLERGVDISDIVRYFHLEYRPHNTQDQSFGVTERNRQALRDKEHKHLPRQTGH